MCVCILTSGKVLFLIAGKWTLPCHRDGTDNAFLFFSSLKSHSSISSHAPVSAIKVNKKILFTWTRGSSRRRLCRNGSLSLSFRFGWPWEIRDRRALISPTCVTRLLRLMTGPIGRPPICFVIWATQPPLTTSRLRDVAYRCGRTGLFVALPTSGNATDATGSPRFDIHYGELAC